MAMMNKMVMIYMLSKSLIDLKNRANNPIPASVKMSVIMFLLVLISYASIITIIIPYVKIRFQLFDIQYIAIIFIILA